MPLLVTGYGFSAVQYSPMRAELGDKLHAVWCACCSLDVGYDEEKGFTCERQKNDDCVV